MAKKDYPGVFRNTDCCGVKEYVGINKHGWKPYWFYKNMMKLKQWSAVPFGDPKCAGHAAYIMTVAEQDNGSDTTGVANLAAFKKYTEKYDLGTIHQAPAAPSGLYAGTHLITVVTFIPNRDKLIPFAQGRGWMPPLDKNRWHAPGYGGVMLGKNVRIHE